MNVAVFHNLPSGGAKRALHEWVKRLVQRHRVGVFTLSTGTHEFCDVRPIAHVHRIYPFEPRVGFRSPFGRLNQLLLLRDLRQLERICQGMARDIHHEGYDVVFVNTCQYTFIPPLVGNLRVPSAYYLHEPFGRGATQVRPASEAGVRRRLDAIDPLPGLYRRHLARLQDQNLSTVTRLLANSDFTRARMQQGYGCESFVSPLGVDADAFRPLPGQRKGTHVLSVGEMSPRKGFDFLVRALALIPEAFRPTLRVAANMVLAEERALVERLAGEQGVALEIKMNLGTEALAREYNEALLCVYGAVNEPFGLVPLEAMACGTPVVAVREGGVPESVRHGHTGLLVERDPRAFAAAVAHVLEHPDLRAKLGRCARQHVESTWTWEASTSTLEGHLVQASMHHGGRPLQEELRDAARL